MTFWNIISILEKEEMLFYDTQNIAVFGVEIKFEWFLVVFQRLILQQRLIEFYPPTGMNQKWL